MGWVNQKGRRYYHRQICRGHRVISVYMGNGPAALQAAEEDAARAAERAALIAAHRAEYELADAIDAAAAPVHDLVATLTKAQLLVTGHHYDHSAWKRIRRR